MSWIVVLSIYLIASATALILYAVDKQRARRGAWRIRESTLHWAELLGGWPGAWVGQRAFKHKRAKGRYMLVFWGIVVLHAAGWGGVIWMKSRGVF